MERYKIQQIIGGGTFGTVYRGTNIKTDEVVAIKKMKKRFVTWDECMALREIKSLRKLTHPNIINLKEVVKVNDELYLIFEFLETNLVKLSPSFLCTNVLSCSIKCTKTRKKKDVRFRKRRSKGSSSRRRPGWPSCTNTAFSIEI